MRVNELGRDRRPLQVVYDLPNLSQILDLASVWEEGRRRPLVRLERGDIEGCDGRGVDLKVQATSNGVLPELGVGRKKKRESSQ